MFERIVYSIAVLCLISAGPSFGQQPANPDLKPAELKELIRRAGLGMNEYRARFKDLTAEEERKSKNLTNTGKLRSNGELLRTWSSISHNWIQT